MGAHSRATRWIMIGQRLDRLDAATGIVSAPTNIPDLILLVDNTHSRRLEIRLLGYTPSQRIFITTTKNKRNMTNNKPMDVVPSANTRLRNLSEPTRLAIKSCPQHSSPNDRRQTSSTLLSTLQVSNCYQKHPGHHAVNKSTLRSSGIQTLLELVMGTVCHCPLDLDRPLRYIQPIPTSEDQLHFHQKRLPAPSDSGNRTKLCLLNLLKNHDDSVALLFGSYTHRFFPTIDCTTTPWNHKSLRARSVNPNPSSPFRRRCAPLDVGVQNDCGTSNHPQCSETTNQHHNSIVGGLCTSPFERLCASPANLRTRIQNEGSISEHNGYEHRRF
jgi:hypothetical protein